MKIELNNKIQIAPSGKEFKLIATVNDGGVYWNVFKYIEYGSLFAFTNDHKQKLNHNEVYCMLYQTFNLKN